MSALQFLDSDVNQQLPPPGFYAATVSSARLTKSHSGHPMVHVVLTLDDVPVSYERVADYFVLDGATSRGVALGRCRLVKLFRACGLDPQPGAPISPGDLVDQQLEVRVDHDEWDGEERLRVVSYRRSANGSLPF
jgi:hypothetical protein